MTLTQVTLNSGRDIELTRLDVFSTYDGMLEGYPCKLINDHLLARLTERDQPGYRSQPIHVITPPRSYPYPDSEPLAFGPVEELPRVYCRASFRSSPVRAELDQVLHRSWLTVVWFQNDLTSPVAEFVNAAVATLAWDEFAEDYEL
ncbi:hypothetical protein ORV05_34450 [Amycolatopsis cynarae]|uniref:Uncharacterized protein n=1 Tax=Amycolatopsis cynarae TaxID=2995223 RepID=A0ABY7B3U3_9PSEU|nr:hypothetical protein [Amycolatopsis sp. HUAS 11-8]WAL65902.1 hypothetical protein ORV05_34450 [Amycolatopsis sp. HUAS 11-8]